jgi:hypothetical protein
MLAIIDWTNQNSGFLTLVLFFVTLGLGWITGIFRALMSKPKFKIGLLPGPTFICTFPTGKELNQVKTHRTAAVIYLNVTNIGTAPSQILSVRIGYHNYSFKYRFLWFWLDSSPAIGDFGHTIGENLRIFPFMLQKSILLPQDVPIYLRSGQNTKGVVYFEQQESWGSFLPVTKNGKVKIKVLITDSYEKKYTNTFSINAVDLAYAKKFNQKFGQTLSTLAENTIEEWIQD